MQYDDNAQALHGGGERVIQALDGSPALCAASAGVQRRSYVSGGAPDPAASMTVWTASSRSQSFCPTLSRARAMFKFQRIPLDTRTRAKRFRASDILLIFIKNKHMKNQIRMTNLLGKNELQIIRYTGSLY